LTCKLAIENNKLNPTLETKKSYKYLHSCVEKIENIVENNIEAGKTEEKDTRRKSYSRSFH
jgi:DNA-binding XRE family transcriptional regulator